MIINEKYQIFGSHDSHDYDIMIFVNHIDSIQNSHERIYIFDKELSKIYSDKPVNSNLAIIKDGIIIEVFKGTKDEVNNALYHTYEFHVQKHPLLITQLVERNIELKMLRTARVILSFLSRTKNRKLIKESLKSNFETKLNTLSSINLTDIRDLNKKSVCWNDYLKTLSFQLGQTLSLMDGIELYTKLDIIKYFPELEIMLLRKGENLKILEEYKNKFVNKSYMMLNKIEKLYEHEYK